MSLQLKLIEQQAAQHFARDAERRRRGASPQHVQGAFAASANALRSPFSSSRAPPASVVPPGEVTWDRSVSGFSPLSWSRRPAPAIVSRARIPLKGIGEMSSTTPS